MKSTSAKKVFMVAGFQTMHFQYHQCWDSLTEKFETQACVIPEVSQLAVMGLWLLNIRVLRC